MSSKYQKCNLNLFISANRFAILPIYIKDDEKNFVAVYNFTNKVPNLVVKCMKSSTLFARIPDGSLSVNTLLTLFMLRNVV